MNLSLFSQSTMWVTNIQNLSPSRFHLHISGLAYEVYSFSNNYQGWWITLIKYIKKQMTAVLLHIKQSQCRCHKTMQQHYSLYQTHSHSKSNALLCLQLQRAELHNNVTQLTACHLETNIHWGEDEKTCILINNANAQHQSERWDWLN